METKFEGSYLRLARTYQGLSLDDVAKRLNNIVSRQLVHKIEIGTSKPKCELVDQLAEMLEVTPAFFFRPRISFFSEEQFHFRKQLTTRVSAKQIAMAKTEMFRLLVEFFESELRLPNVNIPSFHAPVNAEEIESAAEKCRGHWGLGNGPIQNVVRIAENAGAIVTTFGNVSAQVDALSVASYRPIIIRNNAKKSVFRQRFDIAHEIGHFVLHEGKVTGDRKTESEANRFASAFLLPRAAMFQFFPAMRGTRFDWAAIAAFKKRWGVSKAAILYRASQLGIIDERQYKSGVITLNRTGEAREEREDKDSPLECPEVVQNALDVLRNRRGLSVVDISSILCITPKLLREIVRSSSCALESAEGEVIYLDRFRSRMPG